ncbi:TetR/AcrR family transcriptional regulator [Marvinbryantia formatexigens]|nr:TetR/AcrR family transcriptional regulator [Marvinbryantia formatexigens]UWO23154.1 TetR/AcrR family transcriptional regulator [Marvinbryantia formatexigens DSM 14469]SDG01547.1 transcriptional regulator, TetR family [Marvinbryantia formatexigens]
MDKRTQENMRVKMCITDALFDLMQEKSISDITVTEIIRRAGVARASYYRNYDSKEDVLVTLIRDVLEHFRLTMDYDLADGITREHVARCFAFFKEFGTYALNLYKSGFAALMLEELNQFHEMIAGTMPASSIERYELYMYMGALFNTAMSWLQSGAKESPEAMAEMFCRCARAHPQVRTLHSLQSP